MQAPLVKKKQARFGSAKKETARSRFDTLRSSWYVNLLLCFLVPLVTVVCTEWLARGTLAANTTNTGFFQALSRHFPSFVIAYLLLLAIYVLLLSLTTSHAAATGIVELLGYVPGVVTYYKLTMRGEPFLPWDFSQIDELFAISGDISITIQPNMVVVLLLFVLLGVLGAFVRLPHKRDLIARLFMAAGALGCSLLLLFGIFLNPNGSSSIGIQEDSWMQDRYYRNHGVITGFLTNLQLLDIEKPSGYNEQAIQAILDEALEKTQDSRPKYGTSYAAAGGNVSQPSIIYLMAESFWDVTQLPGIEYDQDIMPNLTALREEAAYGWAYTPSFGGGTCDVEFEALTGFSMEHLPSGAKPYQQYVTTSTASLPNYLKDRGYTTVAVHGYGAKFWNRNTAYPNLGIDKFVSSADFVNPIMRRGFISDRAMIDRIIEELEETGDTPAFIHAVTMQNHTTYSRDRYPASDLVRITKAPAQLEDSLLGQLEDCATSIREMDEALGRLVEYLRGIDEPTIVVFWGDHLNPMSDGYNLFETTGYIGPGETNSPELHKTPLLIWSNYHSESIDLGTVGTYNLSPIMMDLYGLDMPEYFTYLLGQTGLMGAKTRGKVVHPDGSITEEMTPEQEEAFHKNALLQYDILFGQKYALQYGEE